MLLETFGKRVIGLQISRHGDGMNAEMRPTRHGYLPVYTIGRTYLLELFHTQLQSDLVRFANRPAIRHAYEQLANLEAEYREGGAVYSCPAGKHDDLGISWPCWPGRRSIHTCHSGSEISRPHAGRAGREKRTAGERFRGRYKD